MIAAFSVTPIGVGESVGELVAEAVKVVRDSGLPSYTNAMFTNVEGEWEEVMTLLKQCVDAVAGEAPRVSIVVKRMIGDTCRSRCLSEYHKPSTSSGNENHQTIISGNVMLCRNVVYCHGNGANIK